MHQIVLWRRLLAEFLGTALLVTAVPPRPGGRCDSPLDMNLFHRSDDYVLLAVVCWVVVVQLAMRLRASWSGEPAWAL